MYFGKSIHWVEAIFVIYVTIMLSIRYVIRYCTDMNIYFRRSSQQQNPQQFYSINIDDTKATYISVYLLKLNHKKFHKYYHLYPHSLENFKMYSKAIFIV